MIALLAIPLVCAVAAYVAALHYQLERPALGVFDHTDLWVLATAIAVLPLQYWLLPSTAASAVIVAVALNSVYVLAVAFASRTVRLAIAVTPVAAVYLLHAADGPGAPSTVWASNALLILTVVSIATVWAQTGMTASHTVILCAGLTIYDIAATTLFRFMVPLANNLADTTPAAVFQLPHHRGALGVGDVLVAAILPATFHRTYGRCYARISFITTMAALTIAFVVPTESFPVLAALGPATILLYCYAFRRRQPARLAAPHGAPLPNQSQILLLPSRLPTPKEHIDVTAWIAERDWRLPGTTSAELSLPHASNDRS